MTAETTRIVLGGCEVDLVERAGALAKIDLRAGAVDGPPLAVVSVNLDHVHHFGSGSGANPLGHSSDRNSTAGIEWLNLIDGAPLAAEAKRLTGRSWPRLAGSDLIEPILDLAEKLGVSVGFLGGSTDTQTLLKSKLESERPQLQMAGLWAPSREEISDPVRSSALASEIAATGVGVLVVCLGKPRQEQWISEFGARSGARVLLAFGAVIDFLAERVHRAPRFIADHGLEWMWRLTREPKRLARRYLVQGPPAYLALRRHSMVSAAPVERVRIIVETSSPGNLLGRFVVGTDKVQVAVIVVTYNSEDDIDQLINSVRLEGGNLTIRFFVADNHSADGTVARASVHNDVTVLKTGGNLGYSGALNEALAHIGASETVLVLNPDLVVEPGSIAALYQRMKESSAAIVVPHLLDEEGESYPSLRREPSVIRSVGDALFGSRWVSRSGLLTEMITDAEQYAHPHPVDWATGAALLIDRRIADVTGPWDERFFLYSEETDFFRRVREAGGITWFESSARMRHRQGGSGSSDELVALMAVNRIRYMEKHSSRSHAAIYRATVVLHETLRSYLPSHRFARKAVARRTTWPLLPRATRSEPRGTNSTAAIASIIIPAHNEEAVIHRTLLPLAPLAASGVLEVIVACNGCNDGTVALVQSVPGVRTLDLSIASKVAALNAGDLIATAGVRVYLDADIEVSPDAIFRLVDALSQGTAIAARPTFRYETAGASALVRAYYRARSRVPSLNSALWGAGIYAMNSAGRLRFDRFPDVTADDLYVSSLFASDEMMIVDSQPVLVRTPLRALSLLAVLGRARRGSRELGVDSGRRSGAGVLATIRGPQSAFDALVYTGFALRARLQSLRVEPSGTWERDESARTARAVSAVATERYGNKMELLP